MANLGKVIYINEEDYSTLLNGGSITKGGTTYTYDNTALYVIKNVSAPEYAETAGYATQATQDGNGNVITATYDKKPLVIEVDDTDTSVPSGTYARITTAWADGRNVIVKVTRTEGDNDIVYLPLMWDDHSVNGEYDFGVVHGQSTFYASILTGDTFAYYEGSLANDPHTHGNITTDGKLQTTDITIANGDKLVVTDASNSNRIARASLTFDGSTTTQALSKKGTWEAFAKDGEGTFVVHFTEDAQGNITKDKTFQQIHNAAFTLKKNVVGHLVVDDSFIKIFNLTDDEAETDDFLYFTSIDDTHVAYITVEPNESISKSQSYLATEEQLDNNKLKNIVIVKSGTSPNYTYSLPSGTTASSIATALTNRIMVTCSLDNEIYYYDHTTGSSSSTVLHFKYTDTTADGVVEKDLAIAYSSNAVTLTTTEYNEKLLPAVPNNHGDIIFSDLPYLNTGTPLSADFPIADAPADAPFAKCFGAITASKTFMSDYIPVSPNDELYGEIWAYRASGATGNTGTLYCGINRYDRNKKPIQTNNGVTYFVASGVNTPIDGAWHRYRGTTTIPTTHTAYDGSDGQGVYFIRLRISVNFSSGTIPTFVGGCRISVLPTAREIGILNGASADLNDYGNVDNAIRAYHFERVAPNLMPATDNANVVIDIDSYASTGGYNHQVGFSGSGIYHRWRSASGYGAWRKLLTSDTITSTSTDNAIARFDGTGGQIQNSGVTINDSNHVTATKFITSGGTNSQVVKGDGSLTNAKELPQYEAYLEWGGKNFSGSGSPLDITRLDNLRANRFAFFPPAAITFEYSQDGGVTWTDYGLSDDDKKKFASTGYGLRLGHNTVAGNADIANYLTRITFDTGVAAAYCELNKFYVYISTSGSNTTDGNNRAYCTIQTRKAADTVAGNDVWTTRVEKQTISGNSGFNIINTEMFTTANNTTNTASYMHRDIRFIFSCDSLQSGQLGLNIQYIKAFGRTYWSSVSNLAKHDHLYNYDYLQNATFPAEVSASNMRATNFISSTSSGRTTIVTSGDTSYIQAGNSATAGTGKLIISGYSNVSGNQLTLKFNTIEATGVLTAPTAASGTNTTQVATTAFVQAAISGAGSSGMLVTMTQSGGTYSLDKTYTEIGTALTNGTDVAIKFGNYLYRYAKLETSPATRLVFTIADYNGTEPQIKYVKVDTGSGVTVGNTESSLPLIIPVPDEDDTLTSGTFASITTALAAGREVLLKATMSTEDDQDVYLHLLSDETVNDNGYYFCAQRGKYNWTACIMDDESITFTTTRLASYSELTSMVGDIETLLAAI